MKTLTKVLAVVGFVWINAALAHLPLLAHAGIVYGACVVVFMGASVRVLR